jgi:hypothetical protein
MDNALLSAEAWGSPLSIGLFLVCIGVFMLCLGGFIWLLGHTPKK